MNRENKRKTFEKGYSNKILQTALVAIQFHAVLCLVAQRKGMVIKYEAG